SKPPGIAWQIRLGTALFGNTELGVRSIAILFGTLPPLAVSGLARACHLKPFPCLLAAITFAFTPLGIAATFLAITDVGMVLFWTLATAIFCKMINEQSSKIHLFYYLSCGGLFAGACCPWPSYQ